MNDKIQEFFTKLYYENDLLRYSNCYDYKKGEVDIAMVIETIEENNLSVSITEEF